MSPEVKNVFSTFLATLGAMAANKKLVGSWLVMLTVTVGAIGDKVYVQRTAELAIVETKLDNIRDTVDEIKKVTEENRKMLGDIKVEQARVQAQLAMAQDKKKQ